MDNRVKGYLSSVKEKENNTWTDDDKLRVYSLCQTKPARKVAKIFGTTVIKIYNVKRLAKNGIRNKCYRCGEPLTKKEIAEKKGLIGACHKCKEATTKYKSARRKAALKRNLCGYCGVRPVLPGHTGCQQCNSATYRRRIKEGLCGHCGERPIKKKALCVECISKSVTYTNNYRKEHQYANSK